MISDAQTVEDFLRGCIICDRERSTRKVTSISEALNSGDGRSSPLQACADALYHETSSELEVRLTLTGRGQQSAPGRVIKSQTIRTKVGLDEAVSAARDIFRAWIKRLVQEGQVLIKT